MGHPYSSRICRLLLHRWDIHTCVHVQSCQLLLGYHEASHRLSKRRRRTSEIQIDLRPARCHGFSHSPTADESCLRLKAAMETKGCTGCAVRHRNCVSCLPSLREKPRRRARIRAKFTFKRARPHCFFCPEAPFCRLGLVTNGRQGLYCIDFQACALSKDKRRYKCHSFVFLYHT